MEQVYDAVVVGAGPNGLVAANLLVDAGWKVVVLEAADQPGGAVRSATDIPAPGFTADLFSAFYPLAAASPAIGGLGLGAYGLVWANAPAVLAHVLDDGRAAVLARDEDQTAASLDAFAAGDGNAWRRWARRWREIEQPALGALLRPFPPVRDGVAIARRLGVNRSLRLARLAALPARRFVEEEFRGAGAGLLVAGNALHTDLSPEAAGSSLYGLLLAMLGQHHGFPVPRGGSGKLTDALVARLASKGGELRCGAEVRTVVLGDAGADGVILTDGRRVRARHAVLADVPAPLLYRRLVGEAHLSSRLRHDLTRFQWDNSTVKVNWAIDRPIPWKAAEAGRAGTVHLGGGLDDMTRYSADLATRTVPKRPFIVLGQMSTTDPTRSPAGTEAAWAYAHLPRGDHSPETVAAFADAIDSEVERQAPGFRDAVRARLVQAPTDLQMANAALDRGALNGGTAAIHQQLVFRPTPGLGRPDTPIPGLFLAGSSAHPGGGVHGACGANAARVALLRSRVGRRMYDASVGAWQRYLS
jgi:phytoene dehydrogenase-like protein